MPPASAKQLKIVLFIGYRCNNNCQFCINADKRLLPEKTTGELLGDIYSAAGRKAGTLEIIGGEATMRPDFTALVRAARRLGIPKVVCATNGRVFSDMAAAKAVVDAGVFALIFSIHGPDAKVHDAMTMVPGSFGQLMKGLSNLKKLGFEYTCGNTTVVKGNMRALPALARLYVKLGIKRVEYIFVDPTHGGAKSNFGALVPRISAAAPYMREALRIGLKHGFTGWKARYVPLCHFSGYEGQISEINERAIFTTEHWAPDFKNTDVIGSRGRVSRKKPAVCKGCLKYGICEGIWTEYLRRYGDKELVPFRRGRA